MCGYCSQGYQAGGNARYSSYSSCSGSYSSLESAVKDYEPVQMHFVSEQHSDNEMIWHHAQHAPVYSGSRGYSGLYLQKPSESYNFMPAHFLAGIKTDAVSSKDEEQKGIVMSMARDAFKAATGKEFPNDIIVRICTESELKNAHRGEWNPGITGFSINRRGFGQSEVFAKEDELAPLMLTIGHEIGHVMTLPMPNPVDEEAKAFAFSLAWMDAIIAGNIGDISHAIKPRPAANGLHNVAFRLVSESMALGKEAIEAYYEIVSGSISIEKTMLDF